MTNNLLNTILNSIVADLQFIDNHRQFKELAVAGADNKLFLLAASVTQNNQAEEDLQSALLSVQHDIVPFITDGGEILQSSLDALKDKGYPTQVVVAIGRIDVLVTLKNGFLSLFSSQPVHLSTQLDGLSEEFVELIPGSLPGSNFVDLSDITGDISQKIDTTLNQMAEQGHQKAKVEIEFRVRITPTK